MSLAAHLHAFGARAPLPGDAPFLARLYASTRQDLLGSGRADPTLAASIMSMQQRLQMAGYRARFPDALYLILQEGGEPVARIVVDHGPLALRLVDIALLPQARGRGTGSALLRALQQWAAAHQLPLTLSVHRGNPQARRLYLSMGFAIERADEHADALRWQPA
ncbi:GNAT family N-acetyltransferase [Massilia sp. CCM 8733]|uniref:GNAT family N-acetyltransferase n=1 Tax=Massilia mucilaginosa TaxID=2609282 RepID=A0ABX0NWU2_9BURK|nr:GNAT family N-acetyltransferase [Massilia mucilaginosa]NHZ91229.1 GNAT family N-acetyltransferase [Massilia mucilaginosa]